MQPDTSKQPATGRPANQPTSRFRLIILLCAAVAIIITAAISLTIANHRSAPARQQSMGDGSASARDQDQATGAQDKPSAPTTPSASSAVNTETNQSSTISVTDQGFSPSTMTVATSTPVTWKNDTSGDRAIDMADSTKPGPHSPQLKPGASFTYAFTAAGTYKYVDVTRPDISGTITVKDPGH